MGQVINRYAVFSIAAQVVGVILIWIGAFMMGPAGDRAIGLIFYSYLPTIFLVSMVLNLKGESGMIAGAIYGIFLGVIIYGLIFGYIMSRLTRK
jgi:hypothetical protein